MTEHRPEAPRPVRGASSWARRINDGTVEWLAAYSRVMAVVWSSAAFCGLLLAVWRPSWAAFLTVALLAAWAAVHTWLGFGQLGNPEWKRGDRSE